MHLCHAVGSGGQQDAFSDPSGTVGAHGHDARLRSVAAEQMSVAVSVFACQTHLVTLAHHRGVGVVHGCWHSRVRSQERLVELGDARRDGSERGCAPNAVAEESPPCWHPSKRKAHSSTNGVLFAHIGEVERTVAVHAIEATDGGVGDASSTPGSLLGVGSSSLPPPQATSRTRPPQWRVQVEKLKRSW